MAWIVRRRSGMRDSGSRWERTRMGCPAELRRSPIQVEVQGLRRSPHIVVERVRADADDGAPMLDVVNVFVGFEAPADRVGAGKESLGQRLVDHRHGRGRGGILRAKATAVEDGDPCHGEEALSHVHERWVLRHIVPLVVDRWRSLNFEVTVPHVIGEKGWVLGSDPDHARGRSNGGFKPLVDRNGGRSRIAARGRVDVQMRASHRPGSLGLCD